MTFQLFPGEDPSQTAKAPEAYVPAAQAAEAVAPIATLPVQDDAPQVDAAVEEQSAQTYDQPQGPLV